MSRAKPYARRSVMWNFRPHIFPILVETVAQGIEIAPLRDDEKTYWGMVTAVAGSEVVSYTGWLKFKYPTGKMQFINNRVRILYPNFLVYIGEIDR